jgi:hypothetical protein
MNEVKLKAYTWEDIRLEVKHVNPVLARIIDNLSPSSEFKLYKCSYPFGSEILKKGDLYLPTPDGEYVSLKHPDVSPTLKREIGYNLYSNPLSMVLNHSVEFCIPIEERIIPYAIMRPGDIFGLGTVFDSFVSHFPPSFLWYTTAGARSVSMLSKISDTVSHRRLVQQYQLNQSAPKSLLDHWAIFSEIANHPSFGDPWMVDLLFFSHRWVKHLNDKAWIAFRAYLQDLVWEKTAYWRSQFISDLVWTHIQRQEGIKPSAYIADIVKYIFAVSVGALPGFTPAVNNDLGPFDRIAEAYQSVYRLRDYPPIIMQPDYFSMQQGLPVYTSLQFMSVMELSPKSNERTSTIADLYSVQSLVKRYLRGITQGEYNLGGTWLYEIAQHMNYRFYHSNAGQYPNILSTTELPNYDVRFSNLLKVYPGTSFPVTARFLRGCVQLSS